MTLENVHVVLGPPGSGKGTQSQLLADELGYHKIVIGDLRRAFIKSSEAEAQEDKERYDKGIPAPDNIVSKLLRHEIKRLEGIKGIVLDTYPLSMGQAHDLEVIIKELKPNNVMVVFLNVPEEEIVGRITSRKGKEGRSDDDPQIARQRYKEYEKRNAPIKEFYKEKNMLIEINGNQPIEQVHSDIIKAIDR